MRINFLTPSASPIYWRSLEAFPVFFTLAASNLCPHSITISFHTPASKVLAFQSPATPNVRTPPVTINPRFLVLIPSFVNFTLNILNTLSSGNHTSIIWMGVAAHTSCLFERTVVSILSHSVLSRALGRRESGGLISYAVHRWGATRWGGGVRCAVWLTMLGEESAYCIDTEGSQFR